jgi:hypothetical protein
LADGPQDAFEAIDAGEDLGFSERILRRALLAIGGRTEKIGFHDDWAWPPPVSTSPPPSRPLRPIHLVLRRLPTRSKRLLKNPARPHPRKLGRFEKTPRNSSTWHPHSTQKFSRRHALWPQSQTRRLIVSSNQTQLRPQ